MKPLVLAPTSQTPRVDFNASTGQLKIDGRSWSEDVTQFYAPLNDWVNEYILHAMPQTDFYVTLEYFNSASSKMIYKLFMKLIEIVDKGSRVTIHWCFQSNDEEMQEVGVEYRAAIHCSSDLFDFKLIRLN